MVQLMKEAKQSGVVHHPVGPVEVGVVDKNEAECAGSEIGRVLPLDRPGRDGHDALRKAEIDDDAGERMDSHRAQGGKEVTAHIANSCFSIMQFPAMDAKQPEQHQYCCYAYRGHQVTHDQGEADDFPSADQPVCKFGKMWHSLLSKQNSIRIADFLQKIAAYASRKTHPQHGLIRCFDALLRIMGLRDTPIHLLSLLYTSDPPAES
jgi:hypothetical protein